METLQQKEKPNKRFLFGVEGLDKYYSYALVPGTSILVAGHPGAGKTTFASMLCYSNAINGHPCLFISFGEHKEKFIRHMKNFNMNFEELEKKGLFRYVRFPLITSRSALDSFVGDLMNLVAKYKANVVVIDGITPMIQIFEEPKARSFLQSVLYDVPHLINGLLVLIADLPFGEEKIGFGGIDFVVDIVIIMKHRIAHGLLVRTMELRKFRGAPITIAEIPFRIIPGKGIRVFMPPTLEEVSTTLKKMKIKYYKMGIKEIDNVMGKISSNSVILLEKPSMLKYDELSFALFSHFILKNRIKTLVISYASTMQVFKEIFWLSLSDYGLEEEEQNKLYNALEELVEFSFINPARYSLEELYSIEIELVNTSSPQLVVYVDSDVLLSLHGEREQIASSLIYNQLLYNKLNNVLTLWTMTATETPAFRVKEALADYLIKTSCRDPLCAKKQVTIRGLHGKTIVFTEEELKRYLAQALREDAKKL